MFPITQICRRDVLEKKQDNKLLITWPTGDVNVMRFEVQL